MVQLHVVVRRTFLEIEDADECPQRRHRAFSDTCLFDAEYDTASVSEASNCDQCTNDSTSAGSCAGDLSSAGSQAGDDSPRSTRLDFNDDDLVSSPVPSCVWMPVFPAGPQNPVHVKPQSRHQWPAKSKKPCDFAAAKTVSSVDTRTTMMLRNLPSSLTRSNLLEILDGKGLSQKYDFVYLPIDFVSGASLGYAFVNFVDSATAHEAIGHLHGFGSWAGTTSVKVIEACWSDPHQGLQMLVERFRNSRVMHGIVPDEFRPVLFSQGKRIPFPKHTKRIRPPYSGGAQGRFSA